MRTLKVPSVRDHVQEHLLHGGKWELLRYLFSRGARISVFAGAVRDAFLSEECGFRHVVPRDWDIGISHISLKEFDGLLREIGGSKNRYGGFRLAWGASECWELWRQEETVGLRKTKAPFSLVNTLRSFVLSCNAIALDVDRGCIYDHGAVSSIKLGKVWVLEDAILHDRAVFSAKALSLTMRRPFELTAASHCFVRQHLRGWNLVHEFKKVYPRAALFNNLQKGA
jgi:hypothetical protein